MSTVVLPCDPSVPHASALGHCSCWTWQQQCCWCHVHTPGEVDEDVLHQCGAWS